MNQDIKIISERISKANLRELLNHPFADMVKFVADVKRGIITLGGELHADAEVILLEDGSSQQDLWGGNIYPNRENGAKIEFESLINIRPADANNSLEIKDENLRLKIQEIINRLIDFS